MPDPRTQSLFERMADEWGGENPLEIVSWRGPKAVVRAPPQGLGQRDLPGQRFTLEVVSVPARTPVRPKARHSMRPETRLSSDLELAVVRRLGYTPSGRLYPDGPEVYVSPVPSAVLAVALR